MCWRAALCWCCVIILGATAAEGEQDVPQLDSAERSRIFDELAMEFLAPLPEFQTIESALAPAIPASIRSDVESWWLALRDERAASRAALRKVLLASGDDHAPDVSRWIREFDSEAQRIEADSAKRIASRIDAVDDATAKEAASRLHVQSSRLVARLDFIARAEGVRSPVRRNRDIVVWCAGERRSPDSWRRGEWSPTDFVPSLEEPEAGFEFVQLANAMSDECALAVEEYRSGRATRLRARLVGDPDARDRAFAAEGRLLRRVNAAFDLYADRIAQTALEKGIDPVEVARWRLAERAAAYPYVTAPGRPEILFTLLRDADLSAEEREAMLAAYAPYASARNELDRQIAVVVQRPARKGPPLPIHAEDPDYRAFQGALAERARRSNEALERMLDALGEKREALQAKLDQRSWSAQLDAISLLPIP